MKNTQLCPPTRLALIATAIGLSQWANAAPQKKVEDVYQQTCASCHGAKFEGGTGGSLIDGEWKHGGTDDDLKRLIVAGNPQMGMPAFGGTLTDEEIRSLVIFIREKEKAQKLQASPPPKPKRQEVTRTQLHNYRLQTVAEGFRDPWGISWLPDGSILVTEKGGTLIQLGKDGSKQVIEGIPAVFSHGQGGLMDVAVHPDYASNGWVYLSLSETPPTGVADKKCLTAVFRGKIRNARWEEQETIYRAAPEHYSGAGVHFGSRLVLRGGYLFFVIGERGGMMAAQKLDNPVGKTFRVHDDGRIPKDNPFVSQPGADPAIWSLGHRNPQGMVMDRLGDLYLTEHGPRGGDEFNWVKKGANYGWPVITYGMNYNGTPMVAETRKEGMEDPLVYWTPSLAVCGLAVYTGDKFPKWKNDFFAGSLKAKQLVRLRVEDHKVTQQEVILAEVARIRDVKMGPDEMLYLVLNDPGEVVRLSPE